MGKRGPRPMPTAMKLARGNPGKRRVNTREPKPQSGTPECPDWLDEEARVCWAELVPQLEHSGVLTRIDRQALAIYCDTWSRWRAACAFVRKHGEFIPVKDEQGKLKYLHQFPQVGIAQKLLTNLLRYQQEFGLTPSSRSGLAVGTDEASEDIDDFVARKPVMRIAEG